MFKSILVLGIATLVIFSATTGVAISKEPIRILHVMSYHATWKWNREQLQGFKAALTGLDVEYRIVELDTKRFSDTEDILKKAAEAENIIEKWKPDLLYANDDNAQKYISQKHVGSSLPIVFSAVNRDPSEYNFIGAENVTGVTEHEHFVPTIKLLRQLVPGVKRIAVIVDSDPTWKGVMGRIRNNLRQIPNLEVKDWALIRTYSDFQRKVLELHDKVDAIAMLGVFNIKDTQGHNVDYQQLLRWVAENSAVPDFSFWQTRVERGTLCAVAVSGYEQGYMAGTMARRILVDKISPGDIPMVPSSKGLPMISLARARKLGLTLNVNLLLDAKTLPDFTWEH